MIGRVVKHVKRALVQTLK